MLSASVMSNLSLQSTDWQLKIKNMTQETAGCFGEEMLMENVASLMLDCLHGTMLLTQYAVMVL